MDANQQNLLKQLPQVQKLIESDGARALVESYSRSGVVSEIRAQLDVLRGAIRNGGGAAYSEDTFFLAVQKGLESARAPGFQRVINGTGVAIHTNLGRAPLPLAALNHVMDVAAGYSNLEFDLDSGVRGSRYDHVDGLLQQLTGAEAALVVNNNAAAVILALNTLADQGEVIISRGELIEIGGSFRIPDVIARSGARLVEVGATNKTHLADFEGAIGEETRMLLKVHTSNYRIVGFTGSVDRRALVSLGRCRNVPVIEDLGSGTLVDLTRYGLPGEDTVQEAIQSGVDVVMFSGDKLLGGPQAGVIVGKKCFIEEMKKNPLLRALRIGKLSLAALDATLRLYLDPDTVVDSVPVLKMLGEGPDELGRRAQALKRALRDVSVLTLTVEDDVGYSGGGSLPGAGIATRVVHVRCANLTPDELAAGLRRGSPPVVGRIADDAFIVDVRTVTPAEIKLVAQALRQLVS